MIGTQMLRRRSVGITSRCQFKLHTLFGWDYKFIIQHSSYCLEIFGRDTDVYDYATFECDGTIALARFKSYGTSRRHSEQ